MVIGSKSSGSKTSRKLLAFETDSLFLNPVIWLSSALSFYPRNSFKNFKCRKFLIFSEGCFKGSPVRGLRTSMSIDFFSSLSNFKQMPCNYSSEYSCSFPSSFKMSRCSLSLCRCCLEYSSNWRFILMCFNCCLSLVIHSFWRKSSHSPNCVLSRSRWYCHSTLRF